MCDFRIDAAEIEASFDIDRAQIREMFEDANRAFPDILNVSDDALSIPVDARPLTRIIARSFDGYDLSKAGHSSAI